MHKTKFVSVLLFLGVFLFVSNVLLAQGYDIEEVSYLSETPHIDGQLDEDLHFLKSQSFPVSLKSADSNPAHHASYRMAYGADFLYLCIEVEANQIVFRDRGYQHGDGFHLVLAKTQPGNQPTDEFYVLACSAVNQMRMEWSRTFFWYYNVDDIFLRRRNDIQLAYKEGEAVISFELVLPWKDVYPYHPWHNDNLGFNLCFVKAVGDQDKNLYKLINTELGAENSKREYLPLKFQKPEHEGASQTCLILDKNTIKSGDSLTASAITIAGEEFEEQLNVKLFTGENSYMTSRRHTFPCQKGLTTTKINLHSDVLAAGGYKIQWNSRRNSSEGETYITSLPAFDCDHLLERIEQMKGKVSQASYYTLKHQALEVADELANVYPYETCGKQRIALTELQEVVRQCENGLDVIAGKRGFVRKAYQSELDNTYQPYMVHVPENYDSTKRYPLVVYLHGSASDETDLRGIGHLLGDDCIVMAPFARGTSNCYSWDHAQEDIAESMEAVIGSYSIDEDKIILSGFSMGGYGVYRTYYETPERFKALAVFSGHPDLANEWSDGKQHYPDFSRMKYLKPFKGIPMFIFHGKEDRSCLFEQTQGIIESLKAAGADVTFVTEEDKGHEAMGQESLEVFYQWLHSVLN